MFNFTQEIDEIGGKMADNYDTPPAPTGPKRLVRRREDKVVSGVCGGVADYLEVDATVVRVLWILFSIFYFIGLIAYIAMIFVVPIESEQDVEWRPGPGPGLS